MDGVQQRMVEMRTMIIAVDGLVKSFEQRSEAGGKLIVERLAAFEQSSQTGRSDIVQRVVALGVVAEDVRRELQRLDGTKHLAVQQEMLGMMRTTMERLGVQSENIEKQNEAVRFVVDTNQGIAATMQAAMDQAAEVSGDTIADLREENRQLRDAIVDMVSGVGSRREKE